VRHVAGADEPPGRPGVLHGQDVAQHDVVHVHEPDRRVRVLAQLPCMCTSIQ
jgi:hypothetical protein